MTPKLIAVVMLVSLTFSAGLQVNVANLVAVLKNYGLLLRALLANFVIVPIVGVVIVRIFQLTPEIATGVLLMAITPGVPFVLQAAGRKKGGSLGFAMELAAILPALSIVTVPITAAFVLSSLEASPLPVTHFLPNLLLFQLLPLVVGGVVAARAPGLALKLTRPALLVFIVTLVVLLGLLGPRLVRDILSVWGSRGMLASTFVVVLSVATGWLLGGPERPYRRTLGIATGLRNVGLCLLIATTSFPGGTVASSVMTYLIVQVIVCGLAGAYFKRTAQRTAEA